MATEKTTVKQRSREYPAYSLKEVIDYIKVIGGYPPGTPIPYEDAASLIEVKPTTNSFKYLTSSAKFFGFLTTDGKNIILSDLTKKIVYPTGDNSELLLEIFKTPKLYKELIGLYKNKELPSQIILENVLVNNCGIAPTVKKIAATAFIKSANYVGALQNNVLLTEKIQVEEVVEEKVQEVTVNKSENTAKDNTRIHDIDQDLFHGEFAPSLVIPIGDDKRVVLRMPVNSSTEDAEYALEMIKLYLKRNYKVN